MHPSLSGRRPAVVTALVFAALGAVTGSVRARSAPAQTTCENDQCGYYGAICVTASTSTGCDALDDGSCRTYDCKGIKKP